MTALNQRIARLEAATVGTTGAPRVIRLVCSQGQEEEARQLARAEGWDENSRDICVIRRLVAISGQQPTPITQVISKSW